MIEEHRYFTVRCDKCGKQYTMIQDSIYIKNFIRRLNS